MQSIAAELSVASVLYKAGWPIAFKESNQEGVRTHDLNILGESPAAVEVKSKQDSTPLTAECLVGCVTDAHRQLPDDRPGVVVMVYRDQASLDRVALAAMDGPLVSAMRQKRRIVGTALLAELEPRIQGLVVPLLFARVVTNPTARFNWPVESMFDGLPQADSKSHRLGEAAPGVPWIHLLDVSLMAML